MLRIGEGKTRIETRQNIVRFFNTVSLRRYVDLYREDAAELLCVGEGTPSPYAFSGYTKVLMELAEIYLKELRRANIDIVPTEITGTLGRYIYARAAVSEEVHERILEAMAERKDVGEILASNAELVDETEPGDAKISTAEKVSLLLSDMAICTLWVPYAADEMFVGDIPTVGLAINIVNACLVWRSIPAKEVA